MDIKTTEQRSENMSRIRGKNTRPELLVRSQLHRLGYRFSLHKSNLPGKPDITLSKHKTVIFIHGCFWHQHVGCPAAGIPKTNTHFWNEKLIGNVLRDEQTVSDLHTLGWKVIIIWECETKASKLPDTINRVVGVLSSECSSPV